MGGRASGTMENQEGPASRPACVSEAVAGTKQGPVKAKLSCPSVLLLPLLWAIWPFGCDRHDRWVVPAGARRHWSSGFVAEE